MHIYTNPQLSLDMCESHYQDLLHEAQQIRLAGLADASPKPVREVLADWLYSLAVGVDSNVDYRNQRQPITQ